MKKPKKVEVAPRTVWPKDLIRLILKNERIVGADKNLRKIYLIEN
jgi:hypothetical protein